MCSFGYLTFLYLLGQSVYSRLGSFKKEILTGRHASREKVGGGKERNIGSLPYATGRQNRHSCVPDGHRTDHLLAHRTTLSHLSQSGQAGLSLF